MVEVDPHDDPSADLVVRLLREQAPHLSGRSVRPSQATGSSNWVFRLGEDLAVRLPRSDGYVADLLTEIRWLPRIAPVVTAPVPEVLLEGRPSASFPRPWSVVTWVPGHTPDELDAAQQARLASTLGGFVRSLHDVDASGVPAGSEHWGYRCGEPVTDTIDGWAEEAIGLLDDVLDPDRVREAWQLLRDVPPASTLPCWVHTDLSRENLLVDADGALAGVIDFGGLGVGDRYADLLYAWSLFHEPARTAFRAAAAADDATWARARAGAFVGPGLLTIAGYRHTLPGRTAVLLDMVAAIADEVGVRLR